MRISAAALLLLLFVPALAGASSGTDLFKGLSGELRVVGGEIGLVAAREAAERIMADNPSVKISISMTGAGAGIRRLRLRQADFCLYDRNPSASANVGAPLRFVAYGVDPVAVVANPENTVGPLTSAQLRKLFSAGIRSWKDVGGPAYPVMPIYIEASETEGKPETKPGNVSVSSQPALRFTMARNKETLGCVSMRELDATLKPIDVDGGHADMQSFKDGRYRVYRLMYAALPAEASPLAKAFIDYLSGPEGQALLEKTGYLPLAAKPGWESVLPVEYPDRLATGQ